MADIAAIGGAAAAGRIETGRTRLASSFDTFLTLLTTQLKNQDPTSPLDTNQFTQQLTQMSGVEQQLLTNDLLKAMVEKREDGLTGAVGYIGKSITTGEPVTALKAGKAEWSYALGRDAGSVKLDVVDAAGKVVRSEVGELKAGAHTFTWDGKDAYGNMLADGGRYSLQVSAVDAQGGKAPADVTTQGVVTAVEQLNGVASLVVNGVPIPLSAVRAVRQSV